MRIVLGGTFDPLHAGHRRLLEHAIRLAGDDGSVHLGLVTDRYSATKRSRTVAPYNERASRLKAFFDEHGRPGMLEIKPLDDPYGHSATGDYDAIVASVETVATAHKVNQERTNNDLPRLRVETVEYVLGDDLLPITATRVASGRIDNEGRRLEPLVVAVGSTNPVKLRATQHALRRYMPRVPLDVIGMKVDSGVSEQPHADQTPEGALRRAQAALEAGLEQGAEYGVGIEAGTTPAPGPPGEPDILDVQHCTIIDITGHVTSGHGSGFAYPPSIKKRLLEEGITVSEAFSPLTRDPKLGRHEGAVGWLTHGVLDRTRLTEQAVEAAMVPRLRRALYQTGQSGDTSDT